MTIFTILMDNLDFINHFFQNFIFCFNHFSELHCEVKLIKSIAFESRSKYLVNQTFNLFNLFVKANGLLADFQLATLFWVKHLTVNGVQVQTPLILICRIHKVLNNWAPLVYMRAKFLPTLTLLLLLFHFYFCLNFYIWNYLNGF